MGRERPADTAISVVQFLEKALARIERSGEHANDNPFADALYVIFMTVRTAILNGRILEFAEACFEFTAQQAGREGPRLTLHVPAEASNN